MKMFLVRALAGAPAPVGVQAEPVAGIGEHVVRLAGTLSALGRSLPADGAHETRALLEEAHRSVAKLTEVLSQQREPFGPDAEVTVDLPQGKATAQWK